MSEVKMNPEVKAKWVRDLRSGNFRQGTGVLHREINSDEVEGANDHTFCCLGVLCESAVAEGVAERRVSTSFDPSWRGIATYYTPGDETDSSHHYLPTSVRVWSGLPDTDPYVTINGYRARLSQHNDEGRTFAEIADAVEEQL